MALSIVANRELAVRPSDFGARVTNGNLELPEELFRILSGLNIGDAETFYEWIYRVPEQNRLQGLLAEHLGWSVSDFMGAAARFGLVLDGHVSDRMLYPFGKPVARKSKPPTRKKKGKAAEAAP